MTFSECADSLTISLSDPWRLDATKDSDPTLIVYHVVVTIQVTDQNILVFFRSGMRSSCHHSNCL